jgi:tRNA1Val (adenine37-N6)-methyltransferase
MANTFFRFKQFTVHQDRCAMKVTTDGCLFGAWVAAECSSLVKKGTKVLDIGTGTGLLSLMLTQVASCSILAMEIDNDACGQAKENIAGTPWSDNILSFVAISGNQMMRVLLKSSSATRPFMKMN